MWYVIIGIVSAIIGAFIGILFGRKNVKIANEIAAQANQAKAAAEAELAKLKASASK